MTETIMRHLISFIGTLVVFLAYVAGYVSGGFRWWWTGFALIFIYLAIYKLVDAGGGHH